ncbi:MAG: isochorismatase family cysteine hydrolase [Candidatus Binataceae bacterium]|jgi:nicotinamidase/pyrazinamidase
MRPETTLFYDVDTQCDFILPDGKLCIPGTDRIIPKLGAMTDLARSQRIRIIATADRHFPEDPELQRNGGAFPDHCMDGTDGQLKIEATAPLHPLYVANRDFSEAELAAAIAHPGELVIEKQRFDAFTGNRNTANLLGRIVGAFDDIVIYGVYTEVCVADAVRGLRQFGKRLHVVIDATADISDEGSGYRDRWQKEGVALTTVAEIMAQLAHETPAKTPEA